MNTNTPSLNDIERMELECRQMEEEIAATNNRPYTITEFCILSAMAKESPSLEKPIDTPMGMG